jgi:hypothetical protein
MSRREILLCVAVVVGLLSVGIVRAHPFDQRITTENSAGDDWLSYHTYAVSILNDGPLIHAAPHVYWVPGGFLYNYYVAALYAVFGPRPGIVYVVQHGCLAIGAVLCFLWSRRFLSPLLASSYLVATALFLLYTFRWWTLALLSENLAIVLYPLTLFLFSPAAERRSMRFAAAAGLSAGLVILSRPNLLAWPPLLALLLLRPGAAWSRRIGTAVVFGAATLLAIAPLPIRNYIVAGEMSSPRYALLVMEGSLSETVVVSGKRLLFCAGVMIGGWDLQGSEIVVDKRWLLLVILSVAALSWLAWSRRLRWPDAAAVLTLAAAYGPFVVMPALGGYGFRFQHPYGPMLLFLLFRGCHELFARTNGSRGLRAFALRRPRRFPTVTSSMDGAGAGGRVT